MADTPHNGTRPQIVVVDYIDEFYPYTLLHEMAGAAGGEARILRCPTRADVIAACADAAVMITQWVKVDRDLLDALPKLQAVVRPAIGYDIIDVAAATQSGVVVCNAPLFCITEVAEHTMALLLATARRVVLMHQNVTAGRWNRDEQGRLERRALHRVQGQTLGLVGFGRIARAVAERAHAFGLHILAYDPYVDAQRLGFSYVRQMPLDDLLAAADWVSIHTPLSEETRALVGAAQLARMKPTAYLINISRGQVVDEAALIEALQNRRIAGAALDVLHQEPPDPANPLLALDNVLLTPHYGGASAEAMDEALREACESAVAILQGQWPPYTVNRYVTPRVPLRDA